MVSVIYISISYDVSEVDFISSILLIFSAFLLDMALSAQKMIQVLLAEPDITPEKTSIIEDNLIRFLEIKVPSEYFDGLRSFINVRLFNNTRPFQIEEDAGNASPVEESYARGRTNITAMEL